MKKMSFEDFPHEKPAVQEEETFYGTMRASASDDPEDEEEDDDEDEEEEVNDSDWGTVDPLEHDGPPSDMDPGFPGSAV